MGPRNKCIFNLKWLEEPDYKDWLMEDSVKTSARCKVCKKTFDIGNMGESALKSHAKGKVHKLNLKARYGYVGTVVNFFTNKNNQVPNGQLSSGSDTSPSQQSSNSRVTTNFQSEQNKPTSSSGQKTQLSQYVSKRDCLNAEILWTMKVVTSHYSYNSCANLSELFPRMFPDSDIAKQFTCGEKKVAYMASFGLAPHFQQVLRENINAQKAFVILFDESLNSHIKSKQMDIHVRLWEENKVITRYYTSAFMGHGKAEDILNHLEKSTEELNLGNMIQISMDGPNVNLTVFRKLQNKLKEVHNNLLINVGTCGLHIVHGAVKDGVKESGWEVNKLLSSLYYLFKDSPARREDYSEVSGSHSFPLKYCQHRWVENVPVAERAVEVWPHVKKYVHAATAKTVSKPTSTLFQVVQSACKDILTIPMLLCFISICKEVLPFLTLYQSDKPMFPFLSTDLSHCIRRLMRRFIKSDVMDKVKTVTELLNVDPFEKNYLCCEKDVKVGFAAQQELESLLKKGKISALTKLTFHKQCKLFLQKMVKKLIDKCPINYPIVNYLTSLDPREMAKNKETCKNNFERLLKVLCNLKRLQVCKCDEYERQFEDFLDAVASSSRYMDFNPKGSCESEHSRVDMLLFTDMGKNVSYNMLWNDVVYSLMLLSHGQSTVECGFSINREVEEVNLKETSVVARRIICDHVSAVGGIDKVYISPKLMQSAASARHKYANFLEAEKAKQKSEAENNKRKCALHEVEQLKTKKKKLEADIVELTKSADEYAEKAEASSDLTMITKSNSMRRTAKEKQTSLTEIDKLIQEKLSTVKK